MKIAVILGIIYIAGINLAGFFSMGMDKQRARRGEFRISERTLFAIACLGGSVGSMIGMQVFRHKTKHKQFVYGMPVIFLIEAAVFLYLLLHHMQTKTTRTDFGMGTVLTEVIYGADGETVADGIHQLLLELENEQLSWRSDVSFVGTLNRNLAEGIPTPANETQRKWLSDSLTLCENTDGAFDITLRPLIALWGIEEDAPSVPTEEDIAQTLTKCGYENVEISTDGMVSAPEYAAMDLGAVGKGIAADEVREFLDTQDVSGAVISIGGTVLVYGSKPAGGAWQVGIRDPHGGQDAVLGVLTLREDTVVSTSGDYERYFIQDGVRYHHILDPDTGYPAQSGLSSVTVVCQDGLLSDGLSTACFVLGYPDSLPLLEKYHAEAIFVTQESDVFVTEGLESVFTLENPAYEWRKGAYDETK